MANLADAPFPLPNRAKLADVARHAKVSMATASRVLNQPDIVRPEVRDRVWAAIEELSYTPDRTARALSSGKSHTIGAIVPTLGIAIFADGVEALQNRLAELGFTLLLANSQYDPLSEARQLRALLEQGVDGVVLVGDDFSPEVLRLIRSYGVPAVTTYVCDSRHGLPAVGIDNARATYEMTRHLIELGHRRFGIVANSALANDRTRARRDGALAALADVGIKVPRDCVVEVKLPRIADGRLALTQLLRAKDPITAVICTADALAVGVQAEARTLGIAVPDQLSVTGYDDVEFAAQIDPPLTTVNVPAATIGQLAAEHIVGAIRGGDVPLSVRLPARLVFRGTVAPPRAALFGRR